MIQKVPFSEFSHLATEIEQFSPHLINTDSRLGHFPTQAIWETAKWNGIHPEFLMETPKSIDVSLWKRRQGRRAPSCGWSASPNIPGQTACFSAAQLLTFFPYKGDIKNIDYRCDRSLRVTSHGPTGVKIRPRFKSKNSFVLLSLLQSQTCYHFL